MGKRVVWSRTFDVVDVCEQIGVEITKVTDSRVHGLCPMHYERTGKADSHPSWSIDRERGLMNCFSCGYGGTLLRLVIDMQRSTPIAARKFLRDNGWEHLNVTTVVTGEAPVAPVEGVLDVSLDRDWERFTRPPDKAVAARTLTREAVSHFDVRWCTERRAWALPIRTWGGQLLGYQLKRRSMVLNIPDAVDKSSTLFGIDVFPTGEGAVIVESPLDAVRLFGLGYFGLALFGSNLSVAQLRLLSQFTDRVVLALDNDRAGRIETARLATLLRRRVRHISFFDYRVDRDAKDIGDMEDDDIREAMNRACGYAAAVTGGLVPRRNRAVRR